MNGLNGFSRKDYLNRGTSSGLNSNVLPQSDSVQSLRDENKRLQQQVSSLNSLVVSLQSGSFFNNNLIKENLEQKEEIRRLGDIIDSKDRRIAELERRLEDKQKDDFRYTSGTTGISSFELNNLRKRVQSLENELSEKKDQIINLERERYYNSTYNRNSRPMSFTNSDVQKLNEILDKCKIVGGRMLDAICNALPEWRDATSEIREIRSDIVDTLENVYKVLQALLNQRASTQIGNSYDPSQDAFPRRYDGMESTRLLISQVYSIVFGSTSNMASEEQLRSIETSIRSMLQRLNVSTLQDAMTVWLQLQSECDAMRREIDRLKLSQPMNRTSFLPANQSVQECVYDFNQAVDGWVRVLNETINRGAAAAAVSIENESDNSRFDTQEMWRMPEEKLVQFYKHKSKLLEQRIQDCSQIMDFVIEALNKSQQQRADAKEKTVLATDPFATGPAMMGITGTETAELLRMREQERQLKTLLEDCYALIQTYSEDLGIRYDQYDIRNGKVNDIMARIKQVVGPIYGELLPPKWTQNDILLLLQRIQDREKQLYDVNEKQSLLLQEMMQVENERDRERARKFEAEQKLYEKDKEIESLKQQQGLGSWNATNTNTAQIPPVYGTAQATTSPYNYYPIGSTSLPVIE